jgi:hypothetical protein
MMHPGGIQVGTRGRESALPTTRVLETSRPARLLPCWYRACARLGLATQVLLFATGVFAQQVSSPPIAQVLAGGAASVIALQPDGKVIVAGSFDRVRGVARQGLARLNADGTLDLAWDPKPDSPIRAIAVGAGGSVFVAGSFTHIGGLARAGLAKLSGSGAGAADGSWDPKPDGGVYGLAVDGSGSVYVGGYFANIGGRARKGIAKLSPGGSGTADAVWDPAADAAVFAIAPDGGGSVYVAGLFNNIGGRPRARVAKLSTGGAGAADASWNPNPTMLYGSGVGPGKVNCIALDGAGHVYVGGFFDHIGGLARVCLARLAADGTGSADPTWNTIANGEIAALAVDGSGNAYVGGVFTVIGAAGIKGLAKVGYDAAGNFSYVDTYWVPLAWTPAEWLPGTVSNNPIYALASAASGHVFVGGTFTAIGGQTKTGFAKLSTGGGGAADPAWSSVQTPGSVRAVARDAAGRTVIGGSFQFMGDGFTVRNNLARLNADNTLDVVWAPETNGEVNALAIDPANGAVFAAGKFTGAGGATRNRLARLSGSGSGTADPAWNPAADGEVLALALDTAAGYLYAGGTFSSIGGQARGSLAKLSIAGNGGAAAGWNASATPPTTALHTVRALALDGGGGLYVGGNFTALGGLSRRNAARVATGNGAVDSGWNPGPDGPVDAFAVEGGTTYVGGEFGNIGGLARSGLARVASGGSGAADATWNPGANGHISALALDGHGGIFVGGGFTVVGGGVRSLVARVATGGAGGADCNWIVGFSGYTIAFGFAPVALAVDTSGRVHVGGQFSRVGGASCSGYAVLGPATRTSGCALAISSVNAGISPSAGYDFDVTVESRDSLGTAQKVMTDSEVALSLQVGTGTLGGTVTCQIAAGASRCSAPAVTYSKAESGVVIRASRSSGDQIAPGDSAPLTVIGTPPPTRLAITSVGGGTGIRAGVPFGVRVETRDAFGVPRPVTLDTTVEVVLSAGKGLLVGGGSCLISAGSGGCTITAETYSQAEPGVVLTAWATYGSTTLAGSSQPFTVTDPAATRVLTVLNPFDGHITSTPSGLDCSASNNHGACSASFPAGTPVTLAYDATGAGVALGTWGGACSGTAPTCQVTLSSDATVVVNGSGLGYFLFSYDWATMATTADGPPRTRRFEQHRTRVVGRLGGVVAYDQTISAPHDDPGVQAAVSEAGAAVRAAAGTAPVKVSAPLLTGPSDTSLSSVAAGDDTVAVATSVVATTSVGPQAIPVGYLGVCAQVPGGCPAPHATLALLGGAMNVGVLTLTTVQTTHSIVTTETHRIDSTWEVDGVRTARLRRRLPARP